MKPKCDIVDRAVEILSEARDVPCVWEAAAVQSRENVRATRDNSGDPVWSFPVGMELAVRAVQAVVGHVAKNEVANVEGSMFDPFIEVLGHALFVGGLADAGDFAHLLKFV